MPRKKANLNKADQFYIENNLDLGAEQLAEDINANVDTVLEYVQELEPEVPQSVNNDGERKPETLEWDADEQVWVDVNGHKYEGPPPQATTETKVNKNTRMRQLMGRKTRNKKPVASVMTPAASEVADSRRQNRTAKKNRMDGAVHKPFGD